MGEAMSTTSRPGRPSAADSVDRDTEERVASPALRRVLAAIRLSIGWVFLWAFIDKMLALGFSTGRNAQTDVVDTFGKAAWLNGGSPTRGFLGNATSGPFESLYKSFAGAAWADWLFMIGLLGIGLALMLGIAMRLAAACGAVLLVLMWTAVLPPETNPFMDDHIIYALTLIALALAGAGHWWGLGRAWDRLSIVRRYPILR
jgi:thiosulfate dehydrogenase (quinone) large subunit